MILEHIARLEPPSGRVDAVLDTDAYNEIDDQFALAWMMKETDGLCLHAAYAAPFVNQKASSAEEGMEKSYDEALHILKLAGASAPQPAALRGSARFMADDHTPVDSPAARDLIARSRAYTPDHPLYVAAIGAATNVASALLMDDTLRERVCVVWLGGHAHEWPDTREFNMMGDLSAARVLFTSGVPLVQLPCAGVADRCLTTAPEMKHWLSGQNALCEYLYENTVREAEAYAAGTAWSRVIWDVTVPAYLLDRNERMLQSRLTPTPVPQYDGYYGFDSRRPLMRYVYAVRRDAVFDRLFKTLARD